jgi:hypothetical protein
MPAMAGVPFPPGGKSSVANSALVFGPAYKQGHAHPRKQPQDVDRAFMTDAQAVFEARAIQPLMQPAFHSPILPVGVQEFLGAELPGD